MTSLGWRPSLGGNIRTGTFRVDVTCTGDTGGQGKHELRFQGTFVEGSAVAASITGAATGETIGQAAATPEPVANGGIPRAAGVGTGEEVGADDFWAAARAELRPEKSLARVGASAKYVVSAVTAVGLALTVLGLVTTTSLMVRPLAKGLAGAATVVALLAVVLAMSYLAVRPERLNTENVDEVEPWYQHQFRRVWLVALASWLLLLAVVLAGAAGVSSLIAGPGADRPVMTLSVNGTGDERSLSVAVQIGDLEPGLDVDVIVVGDAREVFLTGKTTADALGKATFAASVPSVPPSDAYRLSVEIDGEKTAVTVPDSRS